MASKALIGTFLGGLKADISADVRKFKPRTLRETIELARMREDELAHSKKSPFAETYRYNSKPAWGSNTTTTVSSSSKNSALPAVKKISWEEMQKRREKGLCFNCNERYIPGHRCAVPHVFIIEADPEEEEEIEGVAVETAGEQDPQISLHALTGYTGPKTMRVSAQIGIRTILILIDSGSTHNFIDQKIAKVLGLPITPIKEFCVTVANGERLSCKEKYVDVKLRVQGLTFSVTLFSLPLTGLDVVLGVQWLEKLGPVVCDWGRLSMTIMQGNQKFEILASAERQGRAISNSMLYREVVSGGEVFAITVRTIQGEAENPGKAEYQVAPEIQQILADFRTVMEEPTVLPPVRDFDHRIALKEGAGPVNVWPYRYAHFQKTEIERQVSEMLKSGLIRPSNSPFSSPILLVKKKDGTWRFRTDYRALNAVTIKDRFPIPTVDDMIDELHGSEYFTKLDLRAGYHQIRLQVEDIHKTAFRTHSGHYEYVVMPFGLCNAPSTFQAAMNTIFRLYLRKFILVFFYDILIYSPNWDSHLKHIRTTLEILANHSFVVKPSKCVFGQTEVDYLDHLITVEGVKVDPHKIATMQTWPKPKTITELRGFLGLTGYYRKFVQFYGIIARPLTQLLKRVSLDGI
jgi:hypothetical protein